MPPAVRLPIAFAVAFAAPLAAAPVPRPAPRLVAAARWLDTIVATPQGGIRQGNPNAAVKLLEFGALSCPHCAAFAHDGVPSLRARYIATGRVSYEYRPFLLSGVDFAPSLLVRCQPAAAGLRLIEAFYAGQTAWITPFTKPVADDVQKRIAVLPENRQITAFAASGGLDVFVRTRGVTRAAFDACTSDPAGIAKLKDIREDANTTYALTSVPTFAINGRKVADVSTWAQLQPAIDAAL